MAVNNLIDQLSCLDINLAMITSSQRGHPQLCLNGGFFFRISSQTENKVNWRCIENYCKAKCNTEGSTIGEEYSVNFNEAKDREHNHAPKHTRFEIKEKRRKIKEATIVTSKVISNVAPRQILSSLVNEIKSPESVANMPSYDADRQAIHRYKKLVRPSYPPELKNLSEIDFPQFLTRTLEDINSETKLFLLFDSGKDDPNRFFIFSTKEDLKLLENKDLFADGTFDIAPNLFEQVYSLHALIEGRCGPLVYAILSRKNEEIYIKFLSIVSSHLECSPKSITSNFELAFLNAIKDIFPNTKRYGCFFHFKQAIWRKIQELGLSVAYMKFGNYRKILKIFQVLAFVPPSDVKFLFSKLKSELDSSLEYYDLIIQLFKYMEENWIGFETLDKKGRGRGVRLETKTHKPRYEIELWNIHTRINDCLPRTNNYVEAWHKAFSSMLVTHPLVYSLVDKLREEQKKSSNDLIKLETGVQYKRKPAYILLDDRIKEIQKFYSLDDFEKYFERLSLILDY